MPVSLRNADILFNDSSTQASAVRTSADDTIGSVMMLHSSSGSNLRPGDTIAGSFLFRVTAGGAGTPPFGGLNSAAFGVGGTGINRTTTMSGFGNTATPSSGTWRLLSMLGTASVVSDGYGTATIFPPVLAVRIS
jgi:hypothetical protein